jgi:butyryl-CoA dehydrogenase
MAEALAVALDESAATTRFLLEAAAAGRLEVALAHATLYLEALGQVVVAWRWLEQAFSAAAALDAAPDDDRSFYRGKLAACRYFFRHELTRTGPAWRLLRDLDETTISMSVEEF